MSLILEALKKLDRDKRVPERGFLVMAPAPWPASSRSRMPLAALVLLLAMGIGGALVFWIVRPAAVSVPAPAAVRETAAPVLATLPAVTPAPVTLRQRVVVDEPRLVPEQRIAGAAPPVPASIPPPPPSATTLAAAPVASLAPATTTPVATTPAAVAPVATTPAPVERFTRPFVLQAISARDGQPVAVLNGRMVREGEAIDGVKIVKIGADSVEIEVAGQRELVRF